MNTSVSIDMSSTTAFIILSLSLSTYYKDSLDLLLFSTKIVALEPRASRCPVCAQPANEGSCLIVPFCAAKALTLSTMPGIPT